MPNNVVKTELRLEGEDKLHEGLEHVREQFEHVDEAVMEAGHEIVDMFKQSAAVALGFQLSGAIESVKELGHEAVEAATGMQEQEKAIRGVLAMIDEEGASMEDLSSEAHELNEQFAELGETTGASKGDIVAAFDEMAERTGLATKDVAQLTEEMANAGKAVPGGVGAISSGFSNLASGIIRARNPVVQMIAATGLLHGTAKQVAAQMTKMSPDKAMQLGIDAVEKMGNKMKGLPLTFTELVTSLKTIREEIFESLGAPILKALGGPLDRLRGYFADHKEMVQHWAEVVGDKVGEWVTEAADKIQEGFEYLQDHAEEIKAAFSEGARDVKAAVQFILDHKTGIAEAFAAKQLAGPLLGAAGGLSKAVGLPGMLGGGGKAEEEGGGIGSILSGMFGGGAAAKAGKEAEELGADVVKAWEKGAAAESLGEFQASAREYEAAVGEYNAAVSEATSLGLEGAAAETELAAGLAATGVAAGVLVGLAAALYGAWDLLGDEASSMHDEAVAAWTDIKENFSEAWAELTSGSNSLGADLKDLAHVMGIALLESVRAVSWVIKEMAAATKYLGDAMLLALGPIGVGIGLLKGIGHLTGVLGENKPTALGLEHQTGGEIRAVKADKEHEMGAIKAPPIYNFTGDIHVVQDFKDTDPDRIVLQMKEGFGRAARSKVSASTQVPQSSF
jgi:hypothetical protein